MISNTAKEEKEVKQIISFSYQLRRTVLAHFLVHMLDMKTQLKLADHYHKQMLFHHNHKNHKIKHLGSFTLAAIALQLQYLKLKETKEEDFN